MPLYALNFEQLISADEARNRGNYRCIECKGPLQVRQGRRRRHFYHIKTTPSCRLYSKSEDHLLLQLQIQSLFAKGEISLERPFFPIGRLADACWDRHKLIFEIQCSLITQKESQERIKDYASMGYQVVWLLDDRLFNRKHLRAAELFLRENTCYYLHYQRAIHSLFYDQFELIRESTRLKKGPRAAIHLTHPRHMPSSLPENSLPRQVLQRKENWPLFFEGDIVHKALLSQTSRPLAVSMQNWIFLENSLPLPTKTNKPKIPRWLFTSFCRLIEWFLCKMNS